MKSSLFGVGCVFIFYQLFTHLIGWDSDSSIIIAIGFGVISALIVYWIGDFFEYTSLSDLKKFFRNRAEYKILQQKNEALTLKANQFDTLKLQNEQLMLKVDQLISIKKDNSFDFFKKS